MIKLVGTTINHTRTNVNMKKLSAFGLGITLCMASASSLVHAKEAGSGPNPFSDCGIGAALFSNTTWAAVSSNVIWDIGTTAVTSAVASPETCEGNSYSAAVFINHSYDNLVEDTARGEGEHLTAMLDIYACDSAVRQKIVSEVRDQVGHDIMDTSYTEKDYNEKVRSYYEVVNGTIVSQFTSNCSV